MGLFQWIYAHMTRIDCKCLHTALKYSFQSDFKEEEEKSQVLLIKTDCQCKTHGPHKDILRYKMTFLLFYQKLIVYQNADNYLRINLPPVYTPEYEGCSSKITKGRMRVRHINGKGDGSSHLVTFIH